MSFTNSSVRFLFQYNDAIYVKFIYSQIMTYEINQMKLNFV